MRASLLVAAIILIAAPTASAHGSFPDPPGYCDIDNCPPDPPPCPVLPLYDAAQCHASRTVSEALEWGSYAKQIALYAQHQVGCHIIGGPAC